VDFLRKRLPAQVGRYLEGVEFPVRKEELLGRLERNGVPGPVIGQLRKRPRKASTAAPRTSCRPCEGGVSRPPSFAVWCIRLELSTGELLRTPCLRSL
jgi:hypothetical protein